MLPAAWYPTELPGRHVVLRRHVPENLAAFARWYADPEIAHLSRYQGGPMGPDEISRYFATRALGSESLAMAIHIQATGRLIGTCSLSAPDPVNASVLFHITIGEKDAWGQGYGTEATRLMLGHAFRTLGLHRVGLAVFAFNERAIRSYVRCGFALEGSTREAIWRDGRYWDELHMGILRDEWAALGMREGGDARPAREAGDGATQAATQAAAERLTEGAVEAAGAGR